MTPDFCSSQGRSQLFEPFVVLNSDVSSKVVLLLCKRYMVHFQVDRVKRIWYLSPMRAAKVQASLCIRQNLRCSLIQAVSQEEPSDRKPDPWPL